MQMVQGDWDVPSNYLSRCSYPSSDYVSDDVIASLDYKFCCMNVMLDEAIGEDPLNCFCLSNSCHRTPFPFV
jgi:hypothetical protein